MTELRRISCANIAAAGDSPTLSTTRSFVVAYLNKALPGSSNDPELVRALANDEAWWFAEYEKQQAA